MIESAFRLPRASGMSGRDLEQWEYEVTSGGRVRYVIDDAHKTAWLLYASPRHPKDTDH